MEPIQLMKLTGSALGSTNSIRRIIFNEVHSALADYADQQTEAAVEYIEDAKKAKKKKDKDRYMERAVAKLESAKIWYEKYFKSRCNTETGMDVVGMLTLGLSTFITKPIKVFTYPGRKLDNYYICLTSLIACYLYFEDLRPLKRLVKEGVSFYASEVDGGTRTEFNTLCKQCNEKYKLQISHLEPSTEGSVSSSGNYDSWLGMSIP